MVCIIFKFMLIFSDKWAFPPDLKKSVRDAHICSQSLLLLNKYGSTTSPHGKRQAASQTKPPCVKTQEFGQVFALRENDNAPHGL